MLSTKSIHDGLAILQVFDRFPGAIGFGVPLPLPQAARAAGGIVPRFGSRAAASFAFCDTPVPREPRLRPAFAFSRKTRLPLPLGILNRGAPCPSRHTCHAASVRTVRLGPLKSRFWQQLSDSNARVDARLFQDLKVATPVLMMAMNRPVRAVTGGVAPLKS